MHLNTQAYALGLPLISFAPYADLLEPDVCGEGGEANFGIHIEAKCDSAICDSNFQMHLSPLPLTTCMHEYNIMQPDKWLIFDHRPRSATYPVSHNGKALIDLRLALIMLVDNSTSTLFSASLANMLHQAQAL